LVGVDVKSSGARIQRGREVFAGKRKRAKTTGLTKRRKNVPLEFIGGVYDPSSFEKKRNTCRKNMADSSLV